METYRKITEVEGKGLLHRLSAYFTNPENRDSFYNNVVAHIKKYYPKKCCLWCSRL